MNKEIIKRRGEHINKRRVVNNPQPRKNALLRIDFFHNINRYLEFSRREWFDILLTGITMGFIFSFDKWGDKVFDFRTGIINLSTYTLISVLILFLYVLAIKISGIFNGIRATYYKYGSANLLSVFIAFLTFGYIPVFIPGVIKYDAIYNLRVGKFRAVMVKDWETALAVSGGIAAMLLIIIPLKYLHMITGNEIIRTTITIATLTALYSLIPLPVIKSVNPYNSYMNRYNMFDGGTTGFDLFFNFRPWYFFMAGLTVAFLLLIWLFNYASLLFGLIIGLIFMIAYKAVLETK